MAGAVEDKFAGAAASTKLRHDSKGRKRSFVFVRVLDFRRYLESPHPEPADELPATAVETVTKDAPEADSLRYKYFPSRENVMPCALPAHRRQPV